jgi:quinol monooxygenase YgiN
MILTIGRFEVDGNRRSAFLSFADQLVEEERNAPGCIAFDISEDITQPNRFFMIEQWEDMEALDAHTSSDAFDANEARLYSFVIGDPNWDEYEF